MLSFLRSHPVRNPLLVLLATVTAFLVLGNLAVVGASAWAREAAPTAGVEGPDGVRNFAVVDERVWRGAAPSTDGYKALAARGVTTVVDLRAEENVDVDAARLARLGMTYVHIPIRDGQIPDEEQFERFLAAVDSSDGVTFLHCGAGVGRTGALAAGYLVRTGQSDAGEALRRNLAVGPPSLEQIAFAAALDGDEVQRPPAPVVALSRVLDAPRRLWSRYGI